MEPSVNDVWNQALEMLNARIDRHNLETWILPARPIAASDGCFTLGVPSRFFATWLEDHHADTVREALREITGRDFELAFKILAVEAPFEAVATPEPPPPAREQRRRTGNGTYLNPRYTFARFVVGGNNKMTHAAALAVAEKPARAYNPLFIYGGVGLGKTHVMQAIGNHVLDSRDDLRVWYVSAENFMNEMISAIKEGSTIAFRNKYRGHGPAADRRRPVPRRQGEHSGGVLPHLQHALRRPQADRRHRATARPRTLSTSRSGWSRASSGAW